MVKSKINNIFFYFYLFLINLSFICCIIEIPLQAIKVKGIPKYQNLTIIEQGSPLIENNGSFYYQEGNIEINSELIFFTSIKIGSNSQPFNLLLDTGSSILWVTENNCSSCSSQITRYYNSNSSTTSKGPYDDFFIQYGTGSANGYFYNDNIEYLSNKKFKMYFGVASSAYFTVTNCDGIIGLAKSYTDERISFIHMLKKYGNTDSTVFSIKFENDYFQGGVKGAMFIGEHEDFSKKETVSCPLTFYLHKSFWAGELSSFSLKNNEHEAKSNYKTNIIFDTGTNAIILPTKYLIDIQNDLISFNCYIIEVQNSYQIACNANSNLPDLRFEFNGHTLIFPRKYAFYYTSKNNNYVYSMTVFKDLTDSSFFIMGSPFFFLFHTLFDEENKKLKFYPLHDSIIEKDLNENSNNIFLIILIIALIFIIIISVVVVISLIVYFFVKKRKEKNIENVIKENIRQNISGGLFNPAMN